MMNIILYVINFIYIFIWKKIKRIIYYIKGTHEIVRILKTDDISYKKYKELSNSIIILYNKKKICRKLFV
jgi:hypothetical protein